MELQYSPTFAAVAVQSIFFILALIGSYIVFRFLKGTAQISQKGVQIGGAAAMFVVMFVLLNKFSSTSRDQLSADFDLFSRVEAAQTVAIYSDQEKKHEITVSLSPSTQLVSSRDLKNLDKNKFYVDEEFKLAFAKPVDSHWQILRTDDINLLGINTLPAMDLVLSPLLDNDSSNRPKTLAIKYSKDHEIILSADSTIESIPLNFNIYGDPKVMDIMIKQSLEMTGLDIPEERLDEYKAFFKKTLDDQFTITINSKLPIKKLLSSGVYVTIIDDEFLENLPLFKLRPYNQILDKALNYLMYSKNFASGKISNLYVNHSKNLISYDGSVQLGNVKLNGRNTDLLLNNIGFLTKAGSKVVVIQVIHPSNEPYEVMKILEATLDSLQIVN